MPEINMEQPTLTRMHFSEFQKWQIETGRPSPVYDETKAGWSVPGRDDLFAKRSDMPIWQALAKEQGIEVYLYTPPALGEAAPTAEENTITNAQIKLDLKESAPPEPTMPPRKALPLPYSNVLVRCSQARNSILLSILGCMSLRKASPNDIFIPMASITSETATMLEHSRMKANASKRLVMTPSSLPQWSKSPRRKAGRHCI